MNHADRQTNHHDGHRVVHRVKQTTPRGCKAHPSVVRRAPDDGHYRAAEEYPEQPGILFCGLFEENQRQDADNHHQTVAGVGQHHAEQTCIKWRHHRSRVNGAVRRERKALDNALVGCIDAVVIQQNGRFVPFRRVGNIHRTGRCKAAALVCHLLGDLSGYPAAQEKRLACADGLAGGFQLIAFNRQRVIPNLEVRQLGGEGFPVLHKRFLLTKNFVLFVFQPCGLLRGSSRKFRKLRRGKARVPQICGDLLPCALMRTNPDGGGVVFGAELLHHHGERCPFFLTLLELCGFHRAEEMRHTAGVMHLLHRQIKR